MVVGRRPLPAAVRAGKLRARRARGDGVRGARGGVQCRWPPEIIEDGVSGFLCPPDAVDAMADRGVELLTDAARHKSIVGSAAEVVRSRYCAELIVPLYENEYEKVLRGRGARGQGLF